MNMLPTDLERIQSDFRLRYYHWALDDAHREIRDDFPFLRKIKRASMRGFLNWMQELSPDQQTEVFTALVKRSHKQAVQMAGETMTSREENNRT